MKKKIFAILIATILTLILCFGCGGKNDDGSVSFYMPMGAPALAAAQMMAEHAALDVGGATYAIDYHVVAASGASGSITTAVKNGDPDLALLPVNAAASLLGTGGGESVYGGKYKIVSVNTHGNLYLLRKGAVAENEVKKVAVKNLSAVPGLTYKAVLGAGNYTDNANLASAETPYLANIGDNDQPLPFLTQRGFDAIVVPEPVCTTIMNAPAAARLDLQKVSLQNAAVWGTAKSYAQAVLIVKSDLANAAFVNALTERLAQAGRWLLEENEDGTLKNAAAAIVALTESRDNEGVVVPFTAANLTKDCALGCKIYVTAGQYARDEVRSYLTLINSVSPSPIPVPTDDYFFGAS